jgi:molybdopterin-binding protein
MELLRVPEAARRLNVGRSTLKQWIYEGKVRSIQTPGGHHRIPASEIARMTEFSGRRKVKRSKPVGLEAISGRNKLVGKVTNVHIEGLLAQVTLDIGGQLITSIITRNACEDLGLRKGVRAMALIKSTEVMIIRA